jgi:hypothetical protein
MDESKTARNVHEKRKPRETWGEWASILLVSHTELELAHSFDKRHALDVADRPAELFVA